MQSSETAMCNNVQNICICFKHHNNPHNHLPLQIFDDHYHFAHHKVSKRSLSPATHHQTRLDDDDRVHCEAAAGQVAIQAGLHPDATFEDLLKGHVNGGRHVL